MSKKSYQILNVLTIVVTVLFGLAMLAILLVVVFTQLLNNLKIIAISQVYIYIACLLIYIPLALYQTVVMIGAAIRVLHLIKQQSLGTSQVKDPSKFSKMMQRPFNKIVTLVLVVTFSSLLQILSFIIGVIVSVLNPQAYVVEHFTQCLGVLIVAVMVLLLYNPLLNTEYEDQNQSGQVTERRRSLVQSKVMELRDVPASPSVDSPSPGVGSEAGLIEKP